MTKQFDPRRAKGIKRVTAEANADVVQMFGELNTTFEEFRNAVEAKEKEFEKKFDDIVTTEKLDRIDASIGKIADQYQAEIDKLNSQISALNLNGVDGSVVEQQTPEMREFKANFDEWVRTGAAEKQIEAAYAKGGVMAEMSVGSDPDGGYTAPVEWDRQITRKLQQITPMRKYAGQRNVTGQGFKHLFNTGGTSSGWVGETDARPETNTSKLVPYEFSFGEVYAQPSATRSMLQDSLINIEEFIADEVELEFSAQEATAFVNGDGVNKPKGIMQYTAAIEGALPAIQQHPLGPIAEVLSGHVSELTLDGLVSTVYDLEDERTTPNTAWYANKQTFGTIRKMKNADGDLIWQMPLQAGEPATLLGYAVRSLTGMPDIAANAMPIAFGDMERTYKIFDRVGVQVLRDPLSKKPYILFYTTKRVGGGLWNPEYMRYHKIAA